MNKKAVFIGNIYVIICLFFMLIASIAVAEFSGDGIKGIPSTIEQLTINKNFGMKVSTKIANYTAGGEPFILCDATSGNVDIGLPSTTNITSRIYSIKKIDSSGNVCLINASGSELIDGSETYSLSTQWQSVSLITNGVAWFAW